MKTCYIVSYNGVSNVGGVERVCLYVSNIMTRKGYNVKIVDKEVIEKYWLGKIIRKVCGKVPLLGACIVSSLYVIQKKNKNDIVIANGFNCPIVSVDILFMHGTMKGHNIAIGVRDNLKSNIPILFERWASSLAKNIVSVSYLAVEEIKKFYNHKKDNFNVVNNMVDEKNYYPLYKNNNNGQLNVIFCGRVEKRKGSDKLLQLAKHIDSHDMKVKLIVATNNSNYLVEELSTYSCVDIKIGLEPSQLNDFYNLGDVMYFPSIYEGFEMVTLEALSAGVPVLGNHVGAVAELNDRKELGVSLITNAIDTSMVLEQLEQIAKKYSSSDSKKLLHQYYANNYGVDAYIKKLNVVLSKIN